jgi:uncharacterized RDD family membrane protein YckC
MAQSQRPNPFELDPSAPKLGQSRNYQRSQSAGVPPAVTPPVPPAAQPGWPYPATAFPTPTSGNRLLASFGERLAALIIDTLITAGIILVLSFCIGFTIGFSAGASGATNAPPPSDYYLPTFIMYAMVFILYYLVYPVANPGKTPGKAMMGIRMVRQRSEPYGPEFGLSEAFMRHLIGYFISSIIPIGFLWALVDENNQTWHDMLAGTIVIKD